MKKLLITTVLLYTLLNITTSLAIDNCPKGTENDITCLSFTATAEPGEHYPEAYFVMSPMFSSPTKTKLICTPVDWSYSSSRVKAYCKVPKVKSGSQGNYDITIQFVMERKHPEEGYKDFCIYYNVTLHCNYDLAKGKKVHTCQLKSGCYNPLGGFQCPRTEDMHYPCALIYVKPISGLDTRNMEIPLDFHPFFRYVTQEVRNQCGYCHLPP